MSEETKHTPGPLVYVHEVQSNGHGFELLFDTVRDSSTGKNVCRMHDKALAKQFAAAPDMLAALKEADELVENDVIRARSSEHEKLSEWLAHVCSAIAKAEGRLE